jgi:uncharacterized protein
MRFVIAGSSGFLGTALREALARDGHEVVRLVRGDSPSPYDSRWDPANGQVDQRVVESADVVVNVAGSPVVRLWTESARKSITDSRVSTTWTLAQAVARCSDPPALLVQSGSDRYGFGTGDEVLEESSPPRQRAFLLEVLEQVEGATADAQRAGARVCHLRTGAVLARGSGAFKVMLPFFRLGVGGRVADGRQYFPVISLRDWVAAVLHLATHDSSQGPYNLTAPEPPTNAEFTAAMGRALHRPTRMLLPRPAITTGVGDLSQMLLNSVRAVPARLLAEGFEFRDRTVDEVVRAALRA